MSIWVSNIIERKFPPKKKTFALGTKTEFNNVFEEWVNSKGTVKVVCVENPPTPLFSFRSNKSKYYDFSVLDTDGKLYKKEDITSFVIYEDESIKRFYAQTARIKGSQGITGAMARQRDLKDSRTLTMRFIGGHEITLGNVNGDVAGEMKKTIITAQPKK